MDLFHKLPKFFENPRANSIVGAAVQRALNPVHYGTLFSFEIMMPICVGVELEVNQRLIDCVDARSIEDTFAMIRNKNMKEIRESARVYWGKHFKEQFLNESSQRSLSQYGRSKGASRKFQLSCADMAFLFILLQAREQFMGSAEHCLHVVEALQKIQHIRNEIVHENNDHASVVDFIVLARAASEVFGGFRFLSTSRRVEDAA